jgi:ATP-dependent Clp protease ATP-binding subunit ClpA
MSNRFTERAQRVILIAQEEAKRLNHDYVGTEHVLLGLICLGEGVAANVLANLGIDLRKVRAEVEKIVGVGVGSHDGEVPFTPRAKKVLEFAVEEANHLGQNYVGTEHLLLGCLREEEGVASRVLQNLGLRLEVVRAETLNTLGVADKEMQAPAPASSCSCHPASPVDKLATLIYVLALYKLPLDVVRECVKEASTIRPDAMKNSFYQQYRQLAETFLEL